MEPKIRGGSVETYNVGLDDILHEVFGFKMDP